MTRVASTEESRDDAETDAEVAAPGSDDPPSVSIGTELARVTGLLLLVLLPVHLVTVLLSEPADVDALLTRWENEWWLLADWGFLTVGLAHGLLSLRPRLLALGDRPARTPAGPHGGGDLPVAEDQFGRVAFGLLVAVSLGLYLAACWAMLRLV